MRATPATEPTTAPAMAPPLTPLDESDDELEVSVAADEVTTADVVGAGVVAPVPYWKKSAPT